jgi:hypothetical protein
MYAREYKQCMPGSINNVVLSQVTDKLYHIMLYQVQLGWVGFELTTLAVIGTDCIGNPTTIQPRRPLTFVLYCDFVNALNTINLNLNQNKRVVYIQCMTIWFSTEIKIKGWRKLMECELSFWSYAHAVCVMYFQQYFS